MLKTNSKAARAAIQNYIIENYDGSGYAPDAPETTAETLQEIAAVILNDVKRVNGPDVARCKNYTWFNAFADWAASLPGLLDTCYYYNRSAVDDLGDILQETETERAKYNERDAEKMLSRLIFNELVKAAPGVLY